MKWVRLVFYDYCLFFLCVIFFKVTKKYLMALISPRNSLIMLVIHQRINKIKYKSSFFTHFSCCSRALNVKKQRVKQEKKANHLPKITKK